LVGVALFRSIGVVGSVVIVIVVPIVVIVIVIVIVVIVVASTVVLQRRSGASRTRRIVALKVALLCLGSSLVFAGQCAVIRCWSKRFLRL